MVVVLPFEPATATTQSRSSSRQRDASRLSAARVLATPTTGQFITHSRSDYRFPRTLDTRNEAGRFEIVSKVRGTIERSRTGIVFRGELKSK